MSSKNADQLTLDTLGWIDIVNCGNKPEFCFGANYVGFCSDSHIKLNSNIGV